MSSQLSLQRIEESDAGVFGVLSVDGRVFCLTLEPPDRGNRPETSCIPPGEYRCRRIRSPRFGETFEVAGVPGRSHILFHPGNTPDETRGCILPGRRFGVLPRGRGVMESRAAFAELLARLFGQEECRLRIMGGAAGCACRPLGRAGVEDMSEERAEDQAAGRAAS